MSFNSNRVWLFLNNSYLNFKSIFVQCDWCVKFLFKSCKNYWKLRQELLGGIRRVLLILKVTLFKSDCLYWKLFFEWRHWPVEPPQKPGSRKYKNDAFICLIIDVPDFWRISFIFCLSFHEKMRNQRFPEDALQTLNYFWPQLMVEQIISFLHLTSTQNFENLKV